MHLVHTVHFGANKTKYLPHSPMFCLALIHLPSLCVANASPFTPTPSPSLYPFPPSLPPSLSTSSSSSIFLLHPPLLSTSPLPRHSFIPTRPIRGCFVWQSTPIACCPSTPTMWSTCTAERGNPRWLPTYLPSLTMPTETCSKVCHYV